MSCSTPDAILAAAREAKALAAKATPGPWESVTVLPAGSTPLASWSESPWRVITGPPQVIDDTMLSRRAFTHPPDGDFIAHAGTHYGAIAAALVEASEREAELRAEVERFRSLATELRQWTCCEHYHHGRKEDLHALGQPCPVEARFDAALRAPNNDHEQDGA